MKGYSQYYRPNGELFQEGYIKARRRVGEQKLYAQNSTICYGKENLEGQEWYNEHPPEITS